MTRTTHDPPPISKIFFLLRQPPPKSTLFPYTTLFRSTNDFTEPRRSQKNRRYCSDASFEIAYGKRGDTADRRSEEHTSELQSQSNLVCRLLLEKKISVAHRVDESHRQVRHRAAAMAQQ